MRGTGVTVAIAGSAILHVALLGALDAVHGPAMVGPLARPALPMVPLPPPAPVDDAPLDVVLIDSLPAPAAAPAAAAPTAAAPAAGAARPAAPPSADDDRLAMATTIDPAAGTSRPGEPVGPGEPRAPGTLSMRDARPIAPGVNLWHVPLTVAPPDPDDVPYVPPEPSGQLHPDGGGTFRTVQPGFTGHVARDGRVSFTDTPSAHIRLNIPRPTKLARAAARGVERWYADPGAARRQGDADPDELPGVRAIEKVEPDHSNPEPVIAPIITGGFDATDAVMRANGWDPYAAAKLKWMDETRAERLAMAKAHRRTQLAHSTQSMRRHLARLWQVQGLDDAARRAALFELWDDCDDDAEAAVAAACERTRAAVIAFIRERLPAGSPAAFTADELRAFDARRRSSIPFAPY